jgi:4-hydroxy-tetrahydrodipicolinate reductase
MGRMLLSAVQQAPGCIVAGGTERPANPAVGTDIGRLIGLGDLGLTVSEDTEALFRGCDVVIDFTAPAATVTHARLAAETGCGLVIGTTGLGADDLARIEAAAGSAPIVRAPNMSLGVTLLTALVEQVAARLDDDYDIEVLEMHHRHKVDAPSGTALGLGEAAAAGRKVALETVARRTRDGQTGARPRGEIGFATLRGGDVVGDHEVIFAADGERLILGHKASSREVFARGAVRAAQWLNGRTAGLYSMRDVLGL